ncbi:MAG: hypothetical protein ACLVKO_08810 [Dysgonomonas sp.]
MRKIFSVCLLSLLCFVLSSCSDDDGNGFNWKGDWSNPKDPNYKEGYNPIKGIWISETNAGYAVQFTTDYDMRGLALDNEGKWTLASIIADGYGINDEAIMYVREIRDEKGNVVNKITTYVRYRLENEGKTLSLIPEPADKGQGWEKYTKYSE